MKQINKNINNLDEIVLNKLNNKLKIEIFNLSNEEKAYIAGFLDGDGSILVQIIKVNYSYKFTFRYTIQFVQKKQYHNIMLWLKSKLKVGNIRIRKDNISEYAITSKYAIALIIKELMPYLKIKKKLGKFILKIIEEELKIKNKLDFLKVCKMVDETIKLTYSKKRKITSNIVEQYFNSL